MAPHTVIVLDQTLPVHNVLYALAMRGYVALGHALVSAAREKNAERLDVRIRQVKLRHQLLYPLSRIDSRFFEFVIGPVIPGMRNLGTVAKKQLLQGLGAKGGQFHPNAGLVLHARNVMTPIAPVLAHQPLPARNHLGVTEMSNHLGLFCFFSQSHQVRRHRLGFLIGQPQARHCRRGRVVTRILQPVIEPARIHFFRNPGQIGGEIFVLADHRGRLFRTEPVTAAAAQRIDQGLALVDERRVSGINPNWFRMGL